jgi:hypothetical protein
MQDHGTFDVKLSPQAPAPGPESAELGRQTIDKQFHGELDAHSVGEMIGAFTAVKGSAGYGVMERVTGTLPGKRGSFLLQHSARMNRGAPQLPMHGVPDSGTDELTGLTGTRVRIEDGKHCITFDYSLG